VLLAGAVGVSKRNRDRRTLLIFIPLAILSLLWPLVVPRVSLASASMDQFALLFESLIVGLALFWLHADTLRRHHGFVRGPVSLGLLLLAVLVAVVSAGWTLSDPTLIIFLIFVAVLGAILLVSLAITRRMVHRRYVPLSFMLWLALWSLLLTTTTVALLIVLPLLVFSWGVIEPQIVLLQSVVGLALGLCLYALNLPYMLLMFSSPFFRRRFQDWLGAAPAPGPGSAA
jgi:NADH:ubiquinone oxidoreductase subunit K